MTPTVLLFLLVSSAAFFGSDGAPSSQKSIFAPLREAHLDGRIIGGNYADPGQFPYQIVLYVNGVFACGGSIISQTFILTAAHCLTSQGTYTIRAGSILRDNGQLYQVNRVISHPQFDANNYYVNDVALLELASPLALDANVQIIQLSRSTPQVGTPAIASGWGQTIPGDTTSYPQRLKYLNTKICSTPAEIPEFGGHIFILEGADQGICQGDSGGPTVIGGVQVGIHSFVKLPCGHGFPDGLTNVAYYYDWIQQNVG